MPNLSEEQWLLFSDYLDRALEMLQSERAPWLIELASTHPDIADVRIQDVVGTKEQTVLERLTASQPFWVTIALLIDPASKDGNWPGGSDPGRGKQYDTPNDQFGKFLTQEFLPSEILSKYDIVQDPDGWSIGGHSSGGMAAISAAWFLREFTGDTPWVHLDIAGTAWLDDAKPWAGKGGTGVAVRTLVDLAMNFNGRG